MRVTAFTREALAVRRDRRDMTAKGYELTSAYFMGSLWELARGGRTNHRIVEIAIAQDGKGIWFKTAPADASKRFTFS